MVKSASWNQLKNFVIACKGSAKTSKKLTSKSKIMVFKNMKGKGKSDFTITETLGKGTFGTVYKATKDGGKYAIKEYNSSCDGVCLDAIKEISLLRNLSHKNIIRIIGVNYDEKISSIYPLYKYNLHDAIRQNLKYDKYKITKQLYDGLHYLHSNGILHLDIKPQNILIDKLLTNVVIADFGTSEYYIDEDKSLNVTTLWYRAPEILEEYKNYNYKVDIWSMGCVIAELLMNKVFLAGDSELEQLNYTERVHDELESIKKYYEETPDKTSLWYIQRQGMIKVVKFSCVRDPKSRYSAKQILEMLDVSPKNYGTPLENDKKLLEKMRPKTVDDKLNSQPELTPKMRTIVMDWMVDDVAEYYALGNIISQASIRILDECLTKIAVLKTQLQAYGICSLLIASKIHGRLFDLKDAVYICADAYTEKELAIFEKSILETLNFNVNFPIPAKYDKNGNYFETMKDMKYMLTFF